MRSLLGIDAGDRSTEDARRGQQQRSPIRQSGSRSFLRLFLKRGKAPCRGSRAHRRGATEALGFDETVTRTRQVDVRKGAKKRKLSAAGRKRIIEATKKRWAEYNARKAAAS